MNSDTAPMLGPARTETRKVSGGTMTLYFYADLPDRRQQTTD